MYLISSFIKSVNLKQLKENKKIKYSQKSTTRKFTISHLPDEILRKIFTFLSKNDIFLSVRFVCERWNYLGTDKLALIQWIYE